MNSHQRRKARRYAKRNAARLCVDPNARLTLEQARIVIDEVASPRTMEFLRAQQDVFERVLTTGMMQMLKPRPSLRDLLAPSNPGPAPEELREFLKARKREVWTFTELAALVAPPETGILAVPGIEFDEDALD